MTASVDNKTVLIWDSDRQPPEGSGAVVLWRSFSRSGKSAEYSIPREVEANAEVLRNRYLGWIFDLGETMIDGRKLVDRLSLRDGFSYWWMNSIVEKSYGKSAGLFDAVKLMELEDLVRSDPPYNIILFTHNRMLARAVRSWCRNSGFTFKWKKTMGLGERVSLMQRIFRGLPYPLQAFTHLLRYIIQRWPLRQDKDLVPAAAADVTFVDYLAHLPQEAITRGRYESNYWTGLVDVLNEDEVRVNWLHHYVCHDAVPSAREARNVVARFNKGDVTVNQFHSTVDAALNTRVIMRALRDYCRIVLMGLRMRRVRNHFRLADSHVDLWPLFKSDWRNSMYGATAITNCIFLNLFERELNGLQNQRLGVYLQENQGWEMAFIHAWKAAGHGKLVGVPHATMRFWDMRYFSDLRTYQAHGKNAMPIPDMVAINGPASLAACLQAGFPAERTVEVEALRYLYLADVSPRMSSDKMTAVNQLRVLVLGDYVPSVTRRQMELLADAAESLPSNMQFIMKPHPACSLSADDYPSLNLSVTNSPLSELLGDCDVAFTGHITSAAVDAYVSGLPIVSLLDGDMFNMSPLRDCAEVVSVACAEDLALALCSTGKMKRAEGKDYFCLDKKLNRWRRLLQQSECVGERESV